MNKELVNLRRYKTRLLNKTCENKAEYEEIQDKLNYIEMEIKRLENDLN